MKRSHYFLSVLLLALFVFAQKKSTGLFDKNTDVGHPKNGGDTRFDKANNTYYLKGSGYNIWFNRDEFQYAYKKLKGDFVLTAQFQFVGNGGDPHRKIGWMLRESTDDDAVHISAVAHGDGLTVMQWRTQKGVNMRDPEDEIFFPKKNFEIIQLERKDKKITMRVGNTGEAMQEVGTQEMPNLPNKILAGLFICSHDSNSVVEAKMWNVRIEKRKPR